MILVPLLIVCVILIVIGFAAGKRHGQSNENMFKELFTIGKVSLLPVIIIVAIALIFLFLLLYHGEMIG